MARPAIRPPRLSRFLAPLFCIAFSIATPAPGSAQVDPTQSYFVPLAGLAPVLTGLNAVRLFRGCPNNDGGSSLPNNVRIRVVLLDATGAGIAGLVPYIKFNGGTAAQGFAGNGADSIIATAAWNPINLCPNLTQLFADAPTAADGSTQITFTGAGGVRDVGRKWGHYDSRIPVFVVDATGEVEILGKLLETDPNPPGTYDLRIKSVDWLGGLTAVMNQGELISVIDLNPIVNGIGVNNAVSYWKDFNWSGSVDATDLNIMVAHTPHNCMFPRNP